jgi:general secretion pathway protein B
VSFILDALRKSEHERQRQTGPALAEVPVATPKSRANVWAPIAIALLLLNLVVVGVLLIRKSMREPAASPPAAAMDTPPAPVGAAPGPAPVAAAGGTALASTSPSQSPPVVMPPPASPRPAAPVPGPMSAARNPLEDEATGGAPTLDPGMAAQAASAPPGPPAVTRTPAPSRGSVVYEALPESSTLGTPQYSPQMRAGRSDAGAGSGSRPGSGLPSADELAASGVPGLNLDLHVYATRPEERLVFINSHKYREGDAMQEGPTVRQITPTGVILDYNGRSYLLTHD